MNNQEAGTIAEEAAKLIGAVLAAVNLVADEAAAQTEQGEGSRPTGTGTDVCQWCPVCRAVHLMKATNPEIRAHLAAATASLAQAVAVALTQPTAPPRAADRDTEVERIDIEERPDLDLYLVEEPGAEPPDPAAPRRAKRTKSSPRSTRPASTRRRTSGGES